MGADFLCSIVEIREDVTPDYRDPDDAEVAAFRKSLADGGEEDYKDSEICERLRSAIVEVRCALEENHREAVIWNIRGRQYLVTGGMSWGEEPGELYGALSVLDDAGILARLGLEVPPESDGATPVSEDVKPYTVIGVFSDNGQVWIEHVQAAQPDEASALAVIAAMKRNEWNEEPETVRDYLEQIAVLEVFEGHRTGCLPSAGAVSLTDHPIVRREFGLDAASEDEKPKM